MRLNWAGREYYRVKVETSAPVDHIDMSFDNGETWWPGERDDDQWRWLVHGPKVAPDLNIPACLVPRSCVPLMRIPDLPEIVIRRVRASPISITY